MNFYEYVAALISENQRAARRAFHPEYHKLIKLRLYLSPVQWVELLRDAPAGIGTDISATKHLNGAEIERDTDADQLGVLRTSVGEFFRYVPIAAPVVEET